MQKCIDKNYIPITKEFLVDKFSQLGIKQGDTLLVHASLSSLGYVVGGAETLFLALRDVIGEQGTIVVPSQTVEISDPACWQYPPVPEEWYDVIRDAMPAYSKDLSYSKAMGAFSQFIGILFETKYQKKTKRYYLCYNVSEKFFNCQRLSVSLLSQT